MNRIRVGLHPIILDPPGFAREKKVIGNFKCVWKVIICLKKITRVGLTAITRGWAAPLATAPTTNSICSQWQQGPNCVIVDWNMSV